MGQITQTINSLTKPKPTLLTVFTNFSQVKMLEEFNTYGLVIPGLFEPTNNEITKNLLLIRDHKNVEFDLCISLSGGIPNKIIQGIAKERKIDSICYEGDYPFDIGTDVPYKSKANYFPSISFLKKVDGKGDIILPYIPDYFVKKRRLSDRPVNLCTYGNFLLEKKYENCFADWKYISNTIPSQIFGHNPRIGTTSPTLLELVEVLNHTKIYINTRIYGLFPVECLYALACGCIVLSYPYPGIEDFGVKIIDNQLDGRRVVSDILSNIDNYEDLSTYAADSIKPCRQNTLTNKIMETWRNINEFGFHHYRISGI